MTTENNVRKKKPYPALSFTVDDNADDKVYDDQERL